MFVYNYNSDLYFLDITIIPYTYPCIHRRSSLLHPNRPLPAPLPRHHHPHNFHPHLHHHLSHPHDLHPHHHRPQHHHFFS